MTKITIDRSVVEQALEALGLAKLNGKSGLLPAVEVSMGTIAAYHSEVLRLRAALAEPVQEPVAEVVEDEFSRQVVGIGRWLKLPNGTKLYTTPPQRKPLTDEEIVRIFETPELAGTHFQSPTLKAIAVARAIERAHGIGGQDE